MTPCGKEKGRGGMYSGLGGKSSGVSPLINHIAENKAKHELEEHQGNGIRPPVTSLSHYLTYSVLPAV